MPVLLSCYELLWSFLSQKLIFISNSRNRNLIYSNNYVDVNIKVKILINIAKKTSSRKDVEQC